MTQPDPFDPLRALWAADEPPARDQPFTTAAVARAAVAWATVRDQPRRVDWPRRLLTGLGVAGALAGVVLLARIAPGDPWSMAMVAAALTGGIWIGGRAFSGA